MIRREFKCQHCKRMRPRNPRVKKQEYCGERACQNARKNKWRNKKRRSDDGYRKGADESQKQWLEKNPDYWQRYRDEHPKYTEKNRAKQVLRNKSRRTAMIAKSDALHSFFIEDTRRYEVKRVVADEIAKSDALIVEIIPLTMS